MFSGCEIREPKQREVIKKCKHKIVFEKIDNNYSNTDSPSLRWANGVGMMFRISKATFSRLYLSARENIFV